MSLRTLREYISKYGGKGGNLQFLKDNMLPVPLFTLLPVGFFASADEQQIRNACATSEAEWQALFGENKLFAVRSSALAEDGSERSFAGQFTTVLNVPFSGLTEAVITVWKSGNNERANAYQQAAGVSADTQMAVIIQEMVPATVAGVCFSFNPLNGNDETVINAVPGLGDKLVDGATTAVTYIIKDDIISGQENTLLNKMQLSAVSACIHQLEALYNRPQDIEFAFVDDRFYLLQSRRITTRPTGEKIIWDNSNIVESYPGLTLPLTFSFIEKMYEAVYRQFSLVLGVSATKVSRNATVYANMLGLLNGRVYYNLNSWYRSLAQLPGYSLNAAFMEKMMGVKEKPGIDLSAETSGNKLSSWRDVLMAVYRILKNLRHARAGKDDFIRAFNNIYDQFRHKDYASIPATDILQDYNRFEALMLKEWKAPLVNDFFAMIYFGLLQQQCRKYWPGNKELHNHLVAASADIITTQPLKLLPELAGMMNAYTELRTACLQESAAVVWQLLQQPEYAAVLQKINQYLEDWGERCVAELKLETITYKQAPEKLISIIQTYITNDIFSYHESATAVQQRISAEETALKSLKGSPLKKRVFRHILEQARYFISNRENLRYYRTKGFGMVRRMMTGIGTQLHQNNQLEQPADIFYLKLEEIQELLRAPYEVRGIIAARKKEYELFATLDLPGRITTIGKPSGPVLMPADNSTGAVSGNLLQGIPCSQGVVSGKVYKVDHASALQSINGGILVTYATDPGYVVLFASASGILTERGSLLSHAAIVSREMGIPCIVGIEGLMNTLQDGDELLMDGSTGIVKIMNR